MLNKKEKQAITDIIDIVNDYTEHIAEKSDSYIEMINTLKNIVEKSDNYKRKSYFKKLSKTKKGKLKILEIATSKP